MAKYAFFLCAFTLLSMGAFAEEDTQSNELAQEQISSTDQENAFACICGKLKKPQGPAEIACGCKKSKKPEGTAYNNSNDEYIACECEVGGQEGEEIA